MNIYRLTVYVGVFKFVLGILFNGLLIVYYQLGFIGAIITKNTVELLGLCLLYVLIKYKGYYYLISHPFKGSFNNWGIFLKNVLFISIVPYIEYISLVIYTLYSGYIPDNNQINA